MTTSPGPGSLSSHPRFDAQLRLLRAQTAVERARAVTRESRELVARTRDRWAAPTGSAVPGREPDGTVLQHR